MHVCIECCVIDVSEGQFLRIKEIVKILQVVGGRFSSVDAFFELVFMVWQQTTYVLVTQEFQDGLHHFARGSGN
ncbi:hypothetical protein ASG75_11010 [Rhodanobacter sp. Soil772]|nr:hypothetical protein ASG75_11010 [Rhodanobacter sp. Soil772]